MRTRKIIFFFNKKIFKNRFSELSRINKVRFDEKKNFFFENEPSGKLENLILKINILIFFNFKKSIYLQTTPK